MSAQPAPGPPPARRTPATAVLIGVVALVIGLGLGWLLPSPLSSGGDTDAAGLHGQACDLAAAFFPDGIGADDDRLTDGPRIFELSAIANLTQAAGEKDDSYADAGAAGATVLQGLTTANLEQVNTGLAELRASC